MPIGRYMKAIVYVSESGTVSKVLTDTPGAQVLVLDADVNGCDSEGVVEIDGNEYALDAMAQALPKTDAATVAQVYAGVIHALHRSDSDSAERLAAQLSVGLALDFCASGSGECSCAKFGDNPARCERGIEAAVLKEQAAALEYTFDDLSIGSTTNGRNTVTTPLIARPSGLDTAAWYEFAGKTCELLNNR